MISDENTKKLQIHEAILHQKTEVSEEWCQKVIKKLSSEQIVKLERKTMIRRSHHPLGYIRNFLLRLGIRCYLVYQPTWLQFLAFSEHPYVPSSEV
jgi:hypothetical protein